MTPDAVLSREVEHQRRRTARRPAPARRVRRQIPATAPVYDPDDFQGFTHAQIVAGLTVPVFEERRT